MENKFLKYKPAVEELVGKAGLTLYGHEHKDGPRLYCFYCNKKMPTPEIPNRSSKILKICIAEEFADDGGGIESLKSQLLQGLKSYNPEPSDNESSHLILIK